MSNDFLTVMRDCWNLFAALFVVMFAVCSVAAVVICVSREVFAWVYRRVR